MPRPAHGHFQHNCCLRMYFFTFWKRKKKAKDAGELGCLTDSDYSYSAHLQHNCTWSHGTHIIIHNPDVTEYRCSRSCFSCVSLLPYSLTLCFVWAFEVLVSKSKYKPEFSTSTKHLWKIRLTTSTPTGFCSGATANSSTKTKTCLHIHDIWVHGGLRIYDRYMKTAGWYQNNIFDVLHGLLWFMFIFTFF